MRVTLFRAAQRNGIKKWFFIALPYNEVAIPEIEIIVLLEFNALRKASAFFKERKERYEVHRRLRSRGERPLIKSVETALNSFRL